MQRFSMALGIALLTSLGVAELRAQNKLTTLFTSNNGGSSGGMVYFDLAVTNTVRISDLETNFSATASTPVGIQVWTTSSTYAGKESNQAAWTQVAVDDGNATCAGRDVPTKIKLKTPLIVTPGSYGVALIAVGSAHAYTDGTGSNQVYSDANLKLSAGAANNTPWSTSPITPRVWNGSILYTLGQGLFTSFTATPVSGGSPLRVQFTDTTYTSAPGGITSWAWDFDNDNQIDSTVQNPIHTYTASGFDKKFTVALTTTDGVNPASKLTKPDYILVNPSTAKAEDFGKGSFNQAKPSPIDLPAMTSIYSSATGIRGFYFTAPINFVMNGFEAPNEYTTPETHQTIVCYVLKTAPTGSFAATAADVKFFATGPANTILRPTTPILVQQGEWVGVMGACHAATAASSMRNAYASGPFQSSVLGQPITLTRLYMNADPRTNQGVGTVVPSSGSIARVFIHVPGNVSGQVPSLTSSARPILGTSLNLDFDGKLATAQGGIVFMTPGRLPAAVPTPFGDLLVLPTLLLTVPVPGGRGSIPFPIPNDAGITGVTVAWQGFVFDVTGGLYGMSNGTEWYIGKN